MSDLENSDPPLVFMLEQRLEHLRVKESDLRARSRWSLKDLAEIKSQRYLLRRCLSEVNALNIQLKLKESP